MRALKMPPSMTMEMIRSQKNRRSLMVPLFHKKRSWIALLMTLSLDRTKQIKMPNSWKLIRKLVWLKHLPLRKSASWPKMTFRLFTPTLTMMTKMNLFSKMSTLEVSDHRLTSLRESFWNKSGVLFILKLSNKSENISTRKKLKLNLKKKMKK